MHNRPWSLLWALLTLSSPYSCHVRVFNFPFSADLHQPRDIIMETDMIYLNGTRGTECRWMEKGASQRGNPIHLDARVEGRKTPYTPTQTRPTALPDRDPNLPHCLTLGGLKGRHFVAPRATETHFCRDPTPRVHPLLFVLLLHCSSPSFNVSSQRCVIVHCWEKVDIHL